MDLLEQLDVLPWHDNLDFLSTWLADITVRVINDNHLEVDVRVINVQHCVRTYSIKSVLGVVKGAKVGTPMGNTKTRFIRSSW